MTVKITDYSKKKPSTKVLPHPNATQIEITHHPATQAYEVFFYDRFNTCLDQVDFRYADRHEKRAARDRALNYARDNAPDGVRPKRTNF